MIMLSKTFIDYRKEGNEDFKEVFTISNLYTDKAKNDKYNKDIKTKSSILAPYNTLIQDESSYNVDESMSSFNDFENSRIHLENEIINIGKKVKQFNMNYELNNNGELDNGMIIKSKSKSGTIVNTSSVEISKNNSDTINYFDSYEELEGENKEQEEKDKSERVLNIIHNMGYNKKYVTNCINNNTLCHASAVYYLLMNYGNI